MEFTGSREQAAKTVLYEQILQAVQALPDSVRDEVQTWLNDLLFLTEGTIPEEDQERIITAALGDDWAGDDEQVSAILAGGPRFPDVTVQVTGQDGTIGVIIGAVRRALRRAGKDPAAADQMAAEIFGAGSYAEALAIVMRYVHVT